MQYVLKLPKGKETIISLEDKEKVEKFKWYVSKGYVHSYTLILDNMSLHRFIWVHVHGQTIPEGYSIDHIDNNPLNNTFQNLRVLTPRQQAANKVPIGKHGFRGVSPDHNKWRARFAGIYIGTRDSKEEAGYLWDTYMYQQEDLRDIVKLNMPHNIEKYKSEPTIVTTVRENKQVTNKQEIKTFARVIASGVATCVNAKSFEFLVDVEDYERIKYYTVGFYNKYISILIDGKQIRLARYIMNVTDPHLQVGVRGDRNDFTKKNLFVATPDKIAQAKRKRVGSSSEHYGVSKDKQRNGFEVKLCHDGTDYSRRFKKHEEYLAARFHDLIVLCKIPEENYYRLNFTDWKNPEVLEEWKKHFEI